MADVQRSTDLYRTTVYLSDWTVSPNKEYVILYQSDRDDDDEWHIRGDQYKEGDYVAIYEFPRKENDMPVFMRA